MARRSSQAAGIASIPKTDIPKTDTGTPNEAASGPPRPWWQWLLLYPTLAIALIPAVPQWVETARSIGSGLSREEVVKRDFWAKNQACTKSILHTYDGLTHIKGDADICESGDVLVSISVPGKPAPEYYYWIGLEEWKIAASTFPLATTAFASDRLPVLNVQVARKSFVMCQRYLDKRKLLRVVNIDGHCFDQVVDTYTGQVVSQDSSQCRSC